MHSSSVPVLVLRDGSCPKAHASGNPILELVSRGLAFHIILSSLDLDRQHSPKQTRSSLPEPRKHVGGTSPHQLAQSFVSDLPKLAASWTASEKHTISTSQVNCILVAYEFPSGVLRWMDCSIVMLHSRSMGICRAAFPSTPCLLLSTTTRQLVHGSCSSIIEVRWKIGLFAPRPVFAIEPLVPSSRTRSGSVIPDGVRFDRFEDQDL